MNIFASKSPEHRSFSSHQRGASFDRRATTPSWIGLFALCSLLSLGVALSHPSPLLARESSGASAGAATRRPITKVAVQNRMHQRRHEWSLFTGLLPLDAFKKGITVSGAYTLHFSDLWAWEAIQYHYAFEWQTELNRELEIYDLQATPFERVEQFMTSNLVFKPLYWKGAWLNQSLVYGELLLLAGGGYGWLTESSRPAVDVGLGLRLYHEAGFESRFDVKALSFFNADEQHNELWVALGVSL
ncbi:MAG: hypothetical protein VYD19_04035 [Myxococcota bacterium]|nr:hypothetical protein [Myxococcota bacterium]